jgi:hypothetical protein
MCEACGGSGQPCCPAAGGGMGATCTGSLTCRAPDGGGARTCQ